MVKEFNSLEEIQKYYDEKTSTYVFKENNEYISLVKFNFDLNVEANIKARNITAWDITANDIKAENINAWDINADKIQANRIIAINIDTHNIIARNIDAWNITTHDLFANDINANDILAHNINACNISASNIIACDILYWTVCVAIENIKCKSIKGRYRNAKHFVLDGKLEVEENEKEN